ncbi:CocE/NonD family hydrolase [Martelella endophytica]|uniref:Peptidase S15 n=1 Tax=Martelella endophytica TaxID=1486262 RepID=A0A0D5LP03_MAREN|nr:CocE/NonD family hydrolase [Martelella endophytica]AJY45043.1 peptidase S15 [Martelella endophytica]
MQNFSVRVTGDRPAPFQQIVIPLSDGTKLTARLWLPETPAASEVPVVLEWIPYRQSDGTALADSMMHGYFAENGIAACRVDIRGSGNSEGLLRDEYLKQEQDDALEVIAWLAAQDWCNGNVGMIGISWGGFAGLQIAARRPPALKAIVTACSTDDRYSDDVHFMGGALLNDGLQWGAGLFTQLGRPADPKHAGQDWHDIWMSRLEGLEPPLSGWLSHMERDDFWKHGSVCENYNDIECAVFAVGGWVDGYSDPILRLMENLNVPRKGLIGPWTHMYPTWGQPGPQIGFLQECMRWWRHWLLGEATGIMDEPMLRLWTGEDPKPDAASPEIGGHWIGLDQWPSQRPETVLFADDRCLCETPGETEREIVLDSPLTLGATGGEWCPLDAGGNGPEFAGDQSADDGQSLCFETCCLEKPLHLVGHAVLRLRVAFKPGRALLVIRLNEVLADGRSARVTFIARRLRRLEGIGPDEPFDVEIPINAVAHRFSPGSRLRLALSTSYWPMIWPEPTENAIRLQPGSLKLTLPGMPTEADLRQPEFGEAVHAAPVESVIHVAPEYRRWMTLDQASGKVAVCSQDTPSTWEIDGLKITGRYDHDYAILPRQGQSARAGFQFSQTYERDGWKVSIDTDTQVCWEGGKLALRSRFTAHEAGRLVFERNWTQHFDY